jgi:hypothetical protein
VPKSYQTVDESVRIILDALTSARDKTGLSTYSLFECFLHTADKALHTAAYINLRQEVEGPKEATPFFGIALGELMYRAMNDYKDVLGLCYMALRTVDPRLGQFFTPWSAARLVAEVVAGGIAERSRVGEDEIYILDSACGSGVMLLAIADALPRHLLKERRIVFAGLDLDPLCVAMTRLNLRLHGLLDSRSIIKTMDDLTDEERSRLERAAPIQPDIKSSQVPQRLLQ